MSELWRTGRISVGRALGPIVEFNGDCIVNAANNMCLGGGGVDGAISDRGGERLYAARKALPLLRPNTRVETGYAKITIGGDLAAKFVCHAVGPDLRDAESKEDLRQGLGLLRSAYTESLSVASAHGVRSIAFSLISSGIFRGHVSVDAILKIAIDSIFDFVQLHRETTSIEDILICGFTPNEYDSLGRIWESRSAPPVSSRATPFIQGHKLSYVPRYFGALQDQYDPITNPQGKLALAVAENKLSHPLLAERLAAFPGYTSNVFNYTSATGSPELKTVLSKFLRHFVFVDSDVAADNIVVAPGCCALLHQLAYLLFEPNDSVLIPAPYYPAFIHDFLNLGRVQAVDVNCSQEPDHRDDCSQRNEQHSMELTERALSDALDRARTAGTPCKALLLTNPSNPTGALYTREQLQLAVDWTAANGVHLIIDEIYALSVFSHLDQGDEGAAVGAVPYPWVSVATVLAQSGKTLGNHVHLMWSLSKDFGASGFRVGCLYSHNAALLKAMSSMTDMMQVSRPAQELAAFLLSDHAWIESYLASSRNSLRAQLLKLRRGLESLPLPLHCAVAPQGAIFALVDFTPMLAVFQTTKALSSSSSSSSSSWEAEEALAECMFVRAGIVLTPGECCHCPTAGFFRVCYAWVPDTSLFEFLRRLAELQRALGLGMEQEGAVAASDQVQPQAETLG